MTKQLEALVEELRSMHAEIQALVAQRDFRQRQDEALQTWWCHQVKRAREEERAAVVSYLRAAALGAAARGARERANAFDEAAALVESQDYRREEDR